MGAPFRGHFAAMAAALLAACGGDGHIDGEPLTDVGHPAPVLAEKPEKPKKILVIEGTGGIGLEVVRLALERGHLVSVLARQAGAMPLSDERLQVFGGDILDPLKVARVVAGHDVVVSSLGVAPTRKPADLFSAGMRNILDAMRAAGAGRLITVTGVGAGDSRGHGGFLHDRVVLPLLLETAYDDMSLQEDMVRMSHTEWTIVRPGPLSDGPAETRYRVIRELQGVTAGEISHADVAHFIVAAVEQEAYVGWTVLLTN